MQRFLLALWLCAGLCAPAYAQGTPGSATVIATCGTPPTTYTPGQNKAILQDTTGRTCNNTSAAVTGTVTANQGTGASQTVSNAWPAIVPDSTASGSITTENLVPAGTATAGSAVAIALQDTGTVTIQVTGTYTGALSPQVTTDGTHWVTQTSSSALQNMADGTFSATIGSGSTGIWQIEVNGHAQFRLSALAAVTGTAVITLRGAAGTAQVSIGGVTITPSGTQDTNLKQVNGATVNVGVGAASTGTQRVTTSTDSTIGTVTSVTAIANALPAGTNVIGHVINDAGSAIIGNVRIDQTTPGTTNGVQVNAALPAGSNVIGHVINDASSAVIGHVIADTGSTTAVTGNVTVVQPTGTNLHTVLDATSTTAVTQATASSLNATVVGTGTFATQSTTTPGQRTLVTLDIKTVTTGGTAVNAISSGHRTAGGFLQNPVGATVALCINEIGTATGTTSSGDTICIQPGWSYRVAPAAGAVSVITSDSSHPFSGYGLE